MAKENNGTSRFLQNITDHVYKDFSCQFSKKTIEEIVRSVWKCLASHGTDLTDAQSELDPMIELRPPTNEELASYVSKRFKEQNIDVPKETISKVLAMYVEHFAHMELTEPI